MWASVVNHIELPIPTLTPILSATCDTDVLMWAKITFWKLEHEFANFRQQK
jgi:hypothetical protein